MGFELILLVVLVALVFEFINGFHDTANSIATVVATKVLSPRQAIALAAITNLVGALWGTAVAKTISSGLVDTKVVTQEVIGIALLAGIVWNLLTWYWGLPSSSTHAMVGGLTGAALAASHDNWSVIIWSKPAADHWWKGGGCSGRSSSRCSHRRYWASCSPSSSWAYSICCSETGSRTG